MTPTRSDVSKHATVPDMSIVRAKDGRAVAVTLQLLDEISHHRMTWAQLRAWIDTHLIAPGFMEPPLEVRERSDDVRLRFRFDGPAPPEVMLQLMLAVAHRTVLHHLTKLAYPEVDDHFVHAAIHKQRIRRVTSGRAGRWVPSPEPTDTLSDWIVAYVASDVLTHPEEYEHDLVHCPHCGYVRLLSISAATHTCRPPPPHAEPSEPDPPEDERERLSEAPFGRLPNRRK